MTAPIRAKLADAEKRLRVKIPSDVADFITALNDWECTFGDNEDEKWFFDTITDCESSEEKNFIIDRSLDFRSAWNLDGVIFAGNGLGDFLLLLPDDGSKKLGSTIYVLLHEEAEIKIFASSLQEALANGPEDYFWSDNFSFKLGEDYKLIKGSDPKAPAFTKTTIDNQIRKGRSYRDEDDKLKSRLDDWIDDQDVSNVTELLNGLQYLTGHDDVHYKMWALDKLSTLYLKGFGPVPRDLRKALEYNQRSMDLGSHQAMSNRAACYFAGIGVEKDLSKALELAKRANELSKRSDLTSSKPGKGLYADIVALIEREIRKKK